MVIELKGGHENEEGHLQKKGLYIGATVGLVLFIFVGLLPSSFVGGVLGLRLLILDGNAVETALLSRAVVGLAMVTGYLATGCVFVAGHH